MSFNPSPIELLRIARAALSRNVVTLNTQHTASLEFCADGNFLCHCICVLTQMEIGTVSPILLRGAMEVNHSGPCPVDATAASTCELIHSGLKVLRRPCSRGADGAHFSFSAIILLSEFRPRTLQEGPGI